MVLWVGTLNLASLVVVLLSQMKEAGFHHPLCGKFDNNSNLPKAAGIHSTSTKLMLFSKKRRLYFWQLS